MGIVFLCIIRTVGTKGCKALIQHFVLIPYHALHGFHTALCADSIPPRVTDSIHAKGVIGYEGDARLSLDDIPCDAWMIYNAMH